VSNYEVASSELQPIIGNPFPGQETVTERSRLSAHSSPQQPSPTFPRPVPNVQQQMRPPTPTFNGGVMRSNAQRSPGPADEGIFPINLLSPYHNKWKIKAVVGSKSDIKLWQNQNGSGKLFNVTLLDDSGEIRATAFGQQVDSFYDKLEEGKARVNVAKKQYSPVKNDYEICLESGSIIEEIANRNPTDLIKFDFVRIDNIAQYEKDSTIDVIACKNVRVGDFQGRTLSVFNGTTFLVDVDIKDAKDIRDWFSSQETGTNFASLSSSGSVAIDKNEPKKSLAQVKHEKLGQDEQTDYFSTKATIIFIKREGVSYPACPTCKKKVLEDGEEWRCEKCSRNYPEPDHRYIMTMSVADFSDNAWFQCFNE
ncbi:10233_t:CDS:2, partial [Scutellospora calospora]